MVFKKIGSKIKEINHPLKVAVRLGVSIPIFIVIIFIWSYYILKAAEPVVKHDNIQSPPSSSNPGATINGWNPFDTFCAAQVTATGGTSGGGVTAGGTAVTTAPQPGTSPAPSQQPLSCPTGNVEYRCDGSLPIAPDAPTPYSITQSNCRSDKVLDTKRRWCDVPNLPTDKTGGVQSVLERKIQTHCCKDKKYESNINYWGMGLYLILTLPLIYLLIEKILSNFIIRDIKVGESEVRDVFKDQYEWLGGYISKNGALLVILVLCIYYIVLPLFRFFFVSYKCEDVTSTASSNCNKSCTSDNDCANLHGTGCLSCVNNICQDPSFTDGTSNVALGNIELSVCSLRSLINNTNTDLTNEEINDLYSTFVTSPSATPPTNASKKKDIISLLANDDKAKEMTSYYYKFYPRQEISINDTSNPFRIRLPLPKKLKNDRSGYEPIPGFDYLLNNYIELEDYVPPNSPPEVTNCTAKTEIMCNKNHNCKWANQACSHNVTSPHPSGCPGTNSKRYKLPGSIQAVIANQSTDDNLSLHNKVFRDGKDYNPSTQSYPENMYPCNDVVLSNTLKESAKTTTQTTSTVSHTDMSSWINHFELKRVECADKQGKCYMDNYVCQTDNGTPIPLKDLHHPIANMYTVAQLNDVGCQKALNPCDMSVSTSQPSPQPSPQCTALKESNGYVVEVPQGGTCKYVKWNTNRWQAVSANDPQKQARCIPNDITPVPDGGNYTFDTFHGAKVADWIKRPRSNPPLDVSTHCKAVNRMPRSNIPANLSHYFRWSSLGTPGRPLCSDWPGTCATKDKVKNLQGTYVGNRQQEMCCIDKNTSNNPVSLYVTGNLAAGATPNTISGIVPKGNCSELTTVKCPAGKTKSNTGKFTVGQEARDCCS